MEADQYQESLKSMWDYYNTIKYSREQGQVEIVKNLLNYGMSVEEIAKATQLDYSLDSRTEKK